jgi:TP901 family phage tail tape measure protein
VSGEVRSVVTRLSVENAQAVAGMKQFGDAADTTAGRVERAGVRSGKALDMIGRGTRNTFLAGAASLAVIEKANITFDKQMSAVDAATHETARNMGLLRNAAIKAGADTQFSASQAAQGITELAKAGVSTKAVLGGGLKGALDLAAAGQIDVAEAAETAASAMTQFQLKGRDVPHIADLLAAGAGKAQGSVHDLGMALNQSGLVASQTGLSIEQTTGTLAAFAKAGLIGSDAGTSFKTMLLSLNPRSEQAAKLMKRYNIEAYDAQGNFVGITKYAGKLRDGLKDLTAEQRQRAFSKIFGTDAIRAANILYRNGDKGIKGWIKNVDAAGYAADTAHRQTDNLAGDWERFTGSLESTFIKSGGGFQGGLRDSLQSAEKLVNKFGDLPDAVQSGTVKVLALVTAASGAAYIATKAVKGYDAIKGLSSIGKGAAAVSGSSLGVQKVFVVNMGAGGLGGGPGVGGGSAVVAPTGKKGVVSKAAKGGLAAVEIAMGAALIQQAQDAIGEIGSRGKENGILKAFEKPRSSTASVVVGGTSHSLKHDTSAALNAQKLGGVGAKADQLLAGLVGGDGLTKSLANVKALDSALSRISVKDQTRGWDEYNKVLEKSGLSAADLNKVLPKTAQALLQGGKATGDMRSLLAQTIPTLARYDKQLRTLPRAVQTKVTTPGAINSRADVMRLKRQYDLTPKQVRTLLKLTGVPKTRGDLRGVDGAMRHTDKMRANPKVSVNTKAARGELSSFASYLAQVTRPRTVQVNVHAGKAGGVGALLGQATGGADGMTVPGARRPYGDKVIIAAAPGEEIITNRHGEADRFRADRASGRIPAYADGGTVGAVTGGRAGDSITVTFPAPSVLTASVKAANEIAVAAAYTARSAHDTRAANLQDLNTQRSIRDLSRDLRRKETVEVTSHGKKHKVKRLAVRGLDRTIAEAELRDARAQLLEDRAQLANEAKQALADARTEATNQLTRPGHLRPRVQPRLSDQPGQPPRPPTSPSSAGVVARLRGAKASPALLSRMWPWATTATSVRDPPRPGAPRPAGAAHPAQHLARELQGQAAGNVAT